MPDPDLEIRSGGLGGAVIQPQFGLKIRGTGGPPGPSPGSATGECNSEGRPVSNVVPN